MSSIIHKYEFYIESEVRIVVPEVSRILHIDMDRSVGSTGQVCMWVELEPTSKLCVQVIHVCGTGETNELSEGRKHLGTVIDREFVWHFFDGGKYPL